jgi:hypothetical protein
VATLTPEQTRGPLNSDRNRQPQSQHPISGGTALNNLASGSSIILPSNKPLVNNNTPSNESQHLLHPSSLPQQPIDESRLEGQTPQAVPGFIRLAKDGVTASPYNHKAGNFSPLAGAATSGIEYNKSTPISRSKLIQKIPLVNNPDVHNRMNQGPQGLNQGSRMVGCPPNGPYSPHKQRLQMRANSGSSLAGVKRNAQGQVVRYILLTDTV